MLAVLIASVFFVVLVWVRRRQLRDTGEIQQLKSQLAETQSGMERAEHRFQKMIDLLSALNEHKVSSIGRVTWDELVDFTVQTASSLVGAESVVLLRWNAKSLDYRGVSARGISPQKLAELKVRPGEGVLGRAVQAGKVVSVPNAAAAPGGDELLTAPYLILPLWIHSQVQGLLVFSGFTAGSIASETMRLAMLMANQVELTMENLDLHQNQNRVYAEFVATLSAALGAKDQVNGAHGEQCRAMVRAMGNELHLPQSLIEQMEYGAALHDIGKLGIPDALLLKPSALTQEEYAEVKKHPKLGYQILQQMGFLKAVASIVLYHHEWVNGQGYPEGLAGEEIPLGARMVAILDAWDAMTTAQPYRPAMSMGNAIAELRQQAGSQFDPKLVDVFLQVVDRLERSSSAAVQSGA